MRPGQTERDSILCTCSDCVQEIESHVDGAISPLPILDERRKTVQDRDKQKLEDTEVQLLLEGIYLHYGWDFREYATASLRRRIWKCIRDQNLSTVSAFQERILHDPAYMERFLLSVSVNATAMFRDPGFYRAFRQKAVNALKSYRRIRIWHAGCATGEEVYSLATLLHEEGLYERCLVYATDMNETVLAKAKEGIFPLRAMQEYTENYLAAGGRRSFSEYYTTKYEKAIFRPALRKNIVWAQHNLVTDGSFNEFNAILCRNVMIYFNKSLRSRVHRLLHESLTMSGILALGSKELLQYTPEEHCYETLDGHARLYRKVK
jgi:chemotaxis protein methyltransferase CheR